MDSISKFGSTIDAYVKANPKIQTDDPNLLTIEYEFIVNLFMECIKSAEAERDRANKKLNLVKDVLDL